MCPPSSGKHKDDCRSSSGFMRSDAQLFSAMSPLQKREVHIYLARVALNQWKKFSESGVVPDSYIERVVGTKQDADLDLPRKALDCVVKNAGVSAIQKQYREPLCALQDDDWDIPGEAAFAYYAIHNIFQKYALNKAVDDWLIVNQALSSLGNMSDLIEPTLADAVRQAT